MLVLVSPVGDFRLGKAKNMRTATMTVKGETPLTAMGSFGLYSHSTNRDNLRQTKFLAARDLFVSNQAQQTPTSQPNSQEAY
jgi:hypothetical protein